MTSAISNTATTSHVAPVSASTPKVKTGGSDYDGDNDGSTASAPAASAHLPANLGTHVNTSA